MADSFLAQSLQELDVFELPAGDTLDVAAGAILEILPAMAQLGFCAPPLGGVCTVAGYQVVSGPYELSAAALLELGPFALWEILA